MTNHTSNYIAWLVWLKIERFQLSCILSKFRGFIRRSRRLKISSSALPEGACYDPASIDSALEPGAAVPLWLLLRQRLFHPRLGGIPETAAPRWEDQLRPGARRSHGA